MEQFKICPKCGAEYYPDIIECADCHVALVWPQAASASAAPDRQEEQRRREDAWWGVKRDDRQRDMGDGWNTFEPDEILGQVTSDIERIIGKYRVRLARVGIPSAVLPTTRYQRASARLEQSVIFGNREVIEPAGQVPVGDVLEGFQYDLFVRRTDYEAAREIISEMFDELHPEQPGGFFTEYELGKCPACGAEVPEDATECPDCGLPLADPDDDQESGQDLPPVSGPDGERE